MKAFQRRVRVAGFNVSALAVVVATAVAVMVYWMMANDPLVPDHIPGGRIDDVLILALAGYFLLKILGMKR